MDALSSFSVHPVSEPPTKSRGESKKQKEPVQKREETTPKTIPVDLKPRTKPMMKPSKATILYDSKRSEDTAIETKLKTYLQHAHQEGETLAPGILAYRLRVLRILLTAGIPLSKLENTPAFRQLLEVDHFADSS